MSVVASTYLLVLLRFNPRIFLGHYPKKIRESVPPKSEKERRMSIFLGLLIGVPFASALLWRTATLGSPSFWDLFANASGVLFQRLTPSLQVVFDENRKLSRQRAGLIGATTVREWFCSFG